MEIHLPTSRSITWIQGSLATTKGKVRHASWVTRLVGRYRYPWFPSFKACGDPYLVLLYLHFALLGGDGGWWENMPSYFGYDDCRSLYGFQYKDFLAVEYGWKWRAKPNQATFTTKKTMIWTSVLWFSESSTLPLISACDCDCEIIWDGKVQTIL